MRAIALLFSMICFPAIALADAFEVSSERYSTQADYDAEIDRIFGSDYTLADWRDVKARYAREGGDFLRAAGLSVSGDDGPRTAALTVDGDRYHRGGRRQYFLAWGKVPSSFLVHERAVFDGVPLNLGSWTNDRHLLAVTSNDAAPSPQAEGMTRSVLDVLSKGLTAAGFGEGSQAINLVSGAAEISVAVRGRDPQAVRQSLADTVVSFMPVALRGSTNILGVISEPVIQDGEMKVKVKLPFHFLRTGDPRALDCGDDNPDCKF